MRQAVEPEPLAHWSHWVLPLPHGDADCEL